jgi:hypothetical protein
MCRNFLRVIPFRPLGILDSNLFFAIYSSKSEPPAAALFALPTISLQPPREQRPATGKIDEEEPLGCIGSVRSGSEEDAALASSLILCGLERVRQRRASLPHSSVLVKKKRLFPSVREGKSLQNGYKLRTSQD